MKIEEFDKKWEKYLEEGFYGLAIDNEKIIDYIDSEFDEEIKINPNFKFYQIKIKFGTSRVYADSDKTTEWENKINEILKNL
jgi:hypothetical protein